LGVADPELLTLRVGYEFDPMMRRTRLQNTRIAAPFAASHDLDCECDAGPGGGPSFTVWRRSTLRRRMAELRGRWHAAHDLVRSDDDRDRP
jgi:hypothetical protein